ncbi:hypothetical protein CBER1_01739 [Cercospora berteroae]|uniref:Uncharacterized protein n=1 Tax=Cercospora berteroae TaxID=357750 RepID=A0A2S6CH53_9PEZI|nr:hypothetical protein CBER1_01739 [Cercospora berteroae]
MGAEGPETQKMVNASMPAQNTNTTTMEPSPRPKRTPKGKRANSAFEDKTATLQPDNSALRPARGTYSGKGKGRGTEVPITPQIPDKNIIPGSNPPRKKTCAWTIPTSVAGVDYQTVRAAAALMFIREECDEVLAAQQEKANREQKEAEERGYVEGLVHDAQRKNEERLAEYFAQGRGRWE